jgi:hypothetical protein
MILVLKQSHHGSTEFTPAMAESTGVLPGLSPVSGKPVHAAFDGDRLTSDAGVLLLAEIDRRLGLCERLARCIEDPRAPERVQHTLAEMIRFRALLIAAGYPDANDCDALRSDPAFKMAVGRLPESGGGLCSQPTISRLENLPGPVALKRMMAAMVDLFCDSFATVPRRIVLDIDDTEDRVHGAQQLSLFHAHYDGRCFLPMHIYEATTGKPVAVILRPGKTPDGAEVALVLRHVVHAIRARGQMENLIKAHKLHLASDRTSCSKATANQFRLLIHTAAYWLLHTLRGLAPKASFWRDVQFDTLRLGLIKVAARVTEMKTRIKLSLPTSFPYHESLAMLPARTVKLPP